jgi:hypothetical protein
MKTYFGPLTKESCLYFLFLSVFFFFVLIFTIIGEMIFIFKHSNQLSFARVVSGILLLFNGFIAYFANRLLYTMCTGNYLQ